MQLSEQFAVAVNDLLAMAGEDALLRKRLAGWVNKNFRAHTVNAVILAKERMIAEPEQLIRFRTTGLMGQLVTGLVKSNDCEFTTREPEPRGDILMSATTISFIGKSILDEDQPANND